ncbi:hypothetical protein [Maribacter sp. 2308TA10-17]|uniref:hypothetical protein n=1 Tax=Maribacter sp. 2308TA10-17 TaxID=3386276 RepID=UPI0039BCD49C
MKYQKSLFILIFIFGISCSSYKSNLHRTGQKNEIIENAIMDFLSTNSYRNKSNAFQIEYLDFNENIATVTIDAIIGKELLLQKPDTIGNRSKWFPSKFREKKNKLFVEVDSSHGLSRETISKMSEYGILDSTKVKTGQATLFKIDESWKQTHYFFCKSNITNYRSLKSTAVLGQDTRIEEFKCSE